MASITLSVIEGLERGRVYEGLVPPVTVGREEDNDIQLNDERVSRVHAKIQLDRQQIILTDLNSTNGSRVNGHPVQLRVLRPGDHLQIGRCTLLYGSDEQIEERARQMGVTVAALSPLKHADSDGSDSAVGDSALAGLAAVDDATGEHLQLPLFPDGPPPIPSELAPLQSARLADLLTYVHERLSDVAFDGAEPEEAELDAVIEVPWARWQNMLMLQRDLAVWLRKVASPGEETPEA